jgi:hypothetical protein
LRSFAFMGHTSGWVEWGAVSILLLSCTAPQTGRLDAGILA